MNNLTQKMQERLDKWRSKTVETPSEEKVIRKFPVKFSGKGNQADVYSLEEWEEEGKRNYSRR